MDADLGSRNVEKRPEDVRLEGRVLLLVDDAELMRRQLAGEDLPGDPLQHVGKSPAGRNACVDARKLDEQRRNNRRLICLPRTGRKQCK